MFYSNRQKAILKIGSSESYSTHPLLHCVHAEEYALNFICKKLQYNYSLNDIYILIWKQNAVQEIKPAFCCAWCTKMMTKSKFPLKNIITISDYYIENSHVMMDKLLSIQSAICEEKKNTPLMKIKNSRRPMFSVITQS